LFPIRETTGFTTTRRGEETVTNSVERRGNLKLLAIVLPEGY